MGPTDNCDGARPEVALGEAGRPPRTIAIDGPAGAGKSTIGRLLAETLGYTFLDTGAMYRAVALAAIRDRISPDDSEQLARLARELPVRITRPAPEHRASRAYTVLIGSEDVTGAIRGLDVEDVVSDIARWPEVRSALVKRQRQLAADEPVVMVGRDITTEVLPNAELKIYLDASLGQRAERRFLEWKEKGVRTTLAAVTAELSERDSKDMNREAGALRRAPDAVVVNTDRLNVSETLAAIVRVIRGRTGAKKARQGR